MPDIADVLIDEDETPYCFSFEQDDYEDESGGEEDEGDD